MPCRVIPGVGIVCSRGSTRRCKCGKKAHFLCDGPTGDGSTCDAPLCAKCSRVMGKNQHLCHPCWRKRDQRPPEQEPTGFVERWKKNAG